MKLYANQTLKTIPLAPEWFYSAIKVSGPIQSGFYSDPEYCFIYSAPRGVARSLPGAVNGTDVEFV